MKHIIFAVTILFSCLGAQAQNIVPKPVSVERRAGEFFLDENVRINYSSAELAPLAGYLGEYLPGCRIVFNVGEYGTYTRTRGQIYLELDPAMGLPAEGYRIDVSDDRARICGKDYNGVWNGIQTFLQLLPPEVYGHEGGFGWTIPGVFVEDYPAMEYRGVMLDVARTFVPKEDVIRLIDNISRHKINKFHWHLADDEGWRVEIKSYPKLATVGGFRGGNSPVFAVYGAWDRKYGGFYTQDDIRQVVAYAAVRGVEIIPEIDLPGHSRTAARVYPEILCDYTPDLTASAGYDTRDVWCVACEENYEMLSAIIGELAALFPSETFHLGGDEVSTTQWDKCPHCKALMAERGIDDTARLQDVFMERVIAIAARHGKKAGVWNEAAESGRVARTTSVWAWEGVSEGREAAAAGYPVVFCAGKYFYFDMRQSRGEVGHIWAGIVSPQTVYEFGLSDVGFTASEAARVRGVEATFFSELLLENGRDFLDYQLFPRVCALSEVAWTPAGQRSWSDFERRLAQSHFGRLGRMGIRYRGSGTGFDATDRGISAISAQHAPSAPLKTPRVTFTSSLTERTGQPFSGVESYKSAAWATAACVEGDWLLWTFSEPVTATSIFIKTGYDHLQRGGFPKGTVWVSYDGRNFESAAEMYDLKATITPTRPVRAIKVVSESHGNGESFTIIQPLKIQ